MNPAASSGITKEFSRLKVNLPRDKLGDNRRAFYVSKLVALVQKRGHFVLPRVGDSEQAKRTFFGCDFDTRHEPGFE